MAWRDSLKYVFARPAKGSRAKVLGIAGSTCTGKSTLSKELLKELRENGVTAELIGQDDFYKSKEEVRTIRNRDDPSIIFYDYDHTDALNDVAMLRAIRQISSSCDVVIVEGNMITDLALVAELDYIIFLTIDKERCRERRVARVYDPPDEKGYFDQIVWPVYERTLANLMKMRSNERRISLLESKSIITLSQLIAEFQHLICDQVILTKGLIDSSQAIKWVSSPNCGATSLFIGTTRDVFEGKTVRSLEYEAYDEMAYSEMEKLCKQVRQKHPSTMKIAVHHRIGKVSVGETSVIIATSSPQRKAAIEACEWLINALKERAPIWKKEIYADGSCSWKENKEQPK